MMLHKKGLLIAVKVVTVFMLMAFTLPAPVSAQSNLAARVAIEGPEGAFGDVLLVKDNNDVLIYGLVGSVPPSGKVTITAGSLTLTANATYTGKFPTLSGNSLRITNAVETGTATIKVDTPDGASVTGTIDLDIKADSVFQSIKDYQDEAIKVMAGEQGTVLKGTPPHRLIPIIVESPADQSLVGHVLLTQRLVGTGPSAIIMDEIEGISDLGLSPKIQSVPFFSKIGVYGVPIADLNAPDITKRIHFIETGAFFGGNFVSNGSFFPFALENINSGNVDEIEARNNSAETLFVVPQPTDTIYLRIQYPDANGVNQVFAATIANDITASLEGSVTATNNNTSGAAGAPGADGFAVLQGKADPYALITVYAANDTSSEILVQTGADSEGNFTIVVPPTADFDSDKGEYGRYTSHSTVYLGVLDLLGNESASLTAVENIDNDSVIFDSPVATSQTDGSVIVSGRAEPMAQVLLTGRSLTGTQVFFAGGGKADADGNFSIPADAYYEYNVEIVDMAGNIANVTIPGDQDTSNPVVNSITSIFPRVEISGTAQPYAGIIPFGISSNDAPADPQITDTLPAGAVEFGEIIAFADASGNFTLVVPAAIGSLIYIQAIDPSGNLSQFVPVPLVDNQGNPIGMSLIGFDSLSTVNSIPGIPDTLSGRTIDSNTRTPVSDLVVGAFAGITSETDVGIPYVDLLGELVPVNADGTFSIRVPNYSGLTGEFITDFYLVAFVMNADFTLTDVGFKLIDEFSGFDRVGPDIFFAPSSSDVVLFERGAGSSDVMNINRIYPAGTGAGSADLPADALPYVIIIADGNDDDVIDVNSTSIQRLSYNELDASATGLPLPGVTGIDLGDNHWDAATQSVVGNSVVFIALIDQYGNLSPDPIQVNLDVVIGDPDVSKITTSETAIFGDEDTLEAFSSVTVYKNPDKTGFLGTTTAYENGGFAITGLNIKQESVYIVATDTAGNVSNAVEVKVELTPIDEEPGLQFMVLDGFGVIHTPTSKASAGLLQGDMARALSTVNGTVYMLVSDGSIRRVAGDGALPSDDDLVTVSIEMARDIEVVSTKPFGAYVLMGNGVIVTYGDVPFFGDMSQPDTSINPLPMNDGTDRFFIDQNGNGVWDTEDENGNGVLDISVGIGGILNTEDIGIDGMAGTEGNGVLDEEPIITPGATDQGFGWDIARDLELVKDNDGNVKGYVIMDGLGVLWPFGTDIGAENVRPASTNGYSPFDIFCALELIVEDGKIVDFITMDGLGNLFALPNNQGGVLGAGPTNEAEYSGFLSADQYGYTTYVFDIARDLEMNPVDSNEDGTVNWQDGFYILNGYGGIQAVGGAPKLEDAPFLGMDLARDLDF